MIEWEWEAMREVFPRLTSQPVFELAVRSGNPSAFSPRHEPRRGVPVANSTGARAKTREETPLGASAGFRDVPADARSRSRARARSRDARVSTPANRSDGVESVSEKTTTSPLGVAAASSPRAPSSPPASPNPARAFAARGMPPPPSPRGRHAEPADAARAPAGGVTAPTTTAAKKNDGALVDRLATFLGVETPSGVIPAAARENMTPPTMRSAARGHRYDEEKEKEEEAWEIVADAKKKPPPTPDHRARYDMILDKVDHFLNRDKATAAAQAAPAGSARARSPTADDAALARRLQEKEREAWRAARSRPPRKTSNPKRSPEFVEASSVESGSEDPMTVFIMDNDKRLGEAVKMELEGAEVYGIVYRHEETDDGRDVTNEYDVRRVEDSKRLNECLKNPPKSGERIKALTDLAEKDKSHRGPVDLVDLEMRGLIEYLGGFPEECTWGEYPEWHAMQGWPFEETQKQKTPPGGLHALAHAAADAATPERDSRDETPPELRQTANGGAAVSDLVNQLCPSDDGAAEKPPPRPTQPEAPRAPPRRPEEDGLGASDDEAAAEISPRGPLDDGSRRPFEDGRGKRRAVSQEGSRRVKGPQLGRCRDAESEDEDPGEAESEDEDSADLSRQRPSRQRPPPKRRKRMLLNADSDSDDDRRLEASRMDADVGEQGGEDAPVAVSEAEKTSSEETPVASTASEETSEAPRTAPPQEAAAAAAMPAAAAVPAAEVPAAAAAPVAEAAAAAPATPAIDKDPALLHKLLARCTETVNEIKDLKAMVHELKEENNAQSAREMQRANEAMMFEYGNEMMMDEQNAARMRENNAQFASEMQRAMEARMREYETRMWQMMNEHAARLREYFEASLMDAFSVALGGGAPRPQSLSSESGELRDGPAAAAAAAATPAISTNNRKFCSYCRDKFPGQEFKRRWHSHNEEGCFVKARQERKRPESETEALVRHRDRLFPPNRAGAPPPTDPRRRRN